MSKDKIERQVYRRQKESTDVLIISQSERRVNRLCRIHYTVLIIFERDVARYDNYKNWNEIKD